MTEIIAGKLVLNEVSKNSNGGTEQMARRMVKYLDPELLAPYQIIHSRVREMRTDLKKILVCHDLHNDPEVQRLADPEYRKLFEKIVFVSNWQAQMYSASMGIPYSDFTVIPNAIEPFPMVEKNFDGPIRLIYHTTPHRGLNIAYAVADALSKHVDIQFDVFSSFSVYGWEQRDEPYKKLFDQITEHPKMTYWGGRSNQDVRNKLQDAHIFLYPSVWPETSCIAAIEAMCAGVMPCVPNLAALPETCEHSSIIYQWDEDQNKHANQAFSSIFGYINLIKNDKERASAVAKNLQSRYNQIYQWAAIEPLWNQLLRSHANGSSSD